MFRDFKPVVSPSARRCQVRSASFCAHFARQGILPPMDGLSASVVRTHAYQHVLRQRPTVVPEALMQRFAIILRQCRGHLNHAMQGEFKLLGSMLRFLQNPSPEVVHSYTAYTQTECLVKSKAPAYVMQQHDFVIVRHSVPGKELKRLAQYRLNCRPE